MKIMKQHIGSSETIVLEAGAPYELKNGSFVFDVCFYDGTIVRVNIDKAEVELLNERMVSSEKKEI